MLSPFPPSTIDLAFVVDETITAAALARTLRGAGGPLVEAVEAFDEFHSPQLGAHRKSLAFTVRFRAPDHTLTDAEVGELRQHGIDAVVATHDATLR